MDFIGFAQQQVISPFDMIQHRLVHISATRLRTKTPEKAIKSPVTAGPMPNPREIQGLLKSVFGKYMKR